MTHSIEEARDELVSAHTFRREPAAWAVGMRMQVREADESDFDALDDAVFGTVVDESTVTRFQKAGLCEGSARVAAKGLTEGHYLSFEDAAIAQTVFDLERRNARATRQRIAEVAAEPGAAGGNVVSESDFDALDDAVFGRPGERRS